MHDNVRNYEGINKFKYNIHYIDSERLIASNRQTIYISRDGGNTWSNKCFINNNFVNSVKTFNKLSRRLFRTGVHHIISVDVNNYLIFFSSEIIKYNITNNYFHRTGKMAGSRPLRICCDGKNVFYGEYRRNRERSPVNIWGSDDFGETWNPVRQFNSIRHIHGIFKDPYTGNLWVTTGDKDSESAIWVSTDRFKTIEEVFWGSQQTRCIQLLFTDKYIYFGTDSPIDQNNIYRFHRDRLQLEKLQPVESSVFYGCIVGRSMFFSTVCEPSPVHRNKYAVIWRSDDGERWYPFMKFKKDIWSKKYFQNGQVKFPMGPGDNKHLWIVPFGTRYDQMTIKVKIEK